MREIKFRAWDGKKMWFHDDTSRHGNVTLQFNDISGWGMYIEGNKYWVVGASHSELDVLMQFTGFQDKNGKDIFDGDILSTSNDDPEYDLWEKNDNGTTRVFWNNAGFWDYTNWKMETDGDESIYCKKFVEVIGNIYQNPELI